MKTHARNFIRYVAGYVMVRPQARHFALMLFNRLPGVRSRLLRLLIGGTTLHAAEAHVPIDITDLTPRARRIYADLKTAAKHCRKDNR